MKIQTLKALSDNYIYVIETDSGFIVVDPGEARPVFDFLNSKDKKLLAILITHHHFDHVGGVKDLMEFNPKVYATSSHFDFGVDVVLKEGESNDIEGLRVKVIATPGHTLDHLVFYFPDLKALFSGDTLFAGGCGKLFEGTPKQMFESFEKIRKLPLDTKIYFGHEYTKTNLRFAKTIDVTNADLERRYKECSGQHMTTPSNIQLELLTNPYFRVEDPKIRKELHMEKASPVEVFAKIRLLKDSF